MKLELHHINLSTRDVKELERFYKDILFLDTQTEDLPTLEKKKGYSGDEMMEWTILEGAVVSLSAAAVFFAAIMSI